MIYLDSLFIANSILYLFDKCIFKIIKIKNSIIDIMADQILVYIANDSEWQFYKQKFGKTYRPEEEQEKQVFFYFYY